MAGKLKKTRHSDEITESVDRRCCCLEDGLSEGIYVCSGIWSFLICCFM